MQFDIRFTNGFWKLFDSRAYKEVAMFDTFKEAERASKRRAPKPKGQKS